VDTSGVVVATLLLAGGLSLDGAAGHQTVTRAGFALRAGPNGATNIFRPSPEQIAGALPGGGLEAAVSPAAGGDAGFTTEPSDALAREATSPAAVLSLINAVTDRATEITQSFASLNPEAPSISVPGLLSPAGSLNPSAGFGVQEPTAFDPVSTNPPSINNTPAVSIDSYRLTAFEFGDAGRLTQRAASPRKSDEFVYLMKRTDDPEDTSLQGLFVIISSEDQQPAPKQGSPSFAAPAGGSKSLFFIQESDTRTLLENKGITQTEILAKSGHFGDRVDDADETQDVVGAILLANTKDPSVLFIDGGEYDPDAEPFGQLTGYASDFTQSTGFFIAFDFRSFIDPERPNLGVQPQRYFRFAGMESDAASTVAGGLPGTAGFSVDRYLLQGGLRPDAANPLSDTYLRRNETFLPNGDLTQVAPVSTGLLVANRSSANVDARNVALYVDFLLTGEGAGQISSLAAMTGALFPDAGADRAGLVGGLVGSSKPQADQTSTAIDTNVQTAAVQGNVIGDRVEGANHGFGGNPVMGDRNGYYVLTDGLAPPAGERPVVPTNQGQAGAVDYNFVRLAVGNAADAQILQLGAGPEESLTRRTGDVLMGYAAAFAESRGANSVSILPVIFGGENYGVAITPNAETNRLVATFAGATVADTVSIAFGGLSGAETEAHSAYLSDRVFAARGVAGSLAGSQLVFAGDPGGRSAAALVTGSAIAGGLPAAERSKLCECSFMQWGFFLGDLLNAAGRRDHVHLGTWVAGKVPEALPTQGVADYAGHVIGNVLNQGVNYTSVGNLNMSWNFATRTGTTAIGNFDGASYAGQLQTVGSSVRFVGNLVGSGVPREGGLNGSFFRGAEAAGQAPAALGGNFFVQETSGPAYRVQGTFAGQRQP
jgi:hypothetical protein